MPGLRTPHRVSPSWANSDEGKDMHRSLTVSKTSRVTPSSPSCPLTRVSLSLDPLVNGPDFVGV